MVDWVEIFVPEYGFPGVSNFDCPDCGSKVTPPIGDHTWTCHEAYGGCGSQFKPEKGFKRLKMSDDKPSAENESIPRSVQGAPSESLPLCRIGSHPETGEYMIAMKMENGNGRVVTGWISAQDARDITLALRACAAEIDEKPFFDGGWSTAEAVRYAASELEELSEQYKMKTRSIENSNFEGSRMEDDDE